jgi:hypothetical protein
MKVFLTTERRSDAEIVGEIVKEIARSESAAEITEAEVNVMIDFLRRETQRSLPREGYKKENLKYVAAVRRWIDEGHTLMAACPHGLSFHVLLEAEDERLFSEQEAFNYLSEMLDRLRRGCDWVEKNGYGVHRNLGYRQLEAAYAARDLLEPRGVPVKYSSPTSTYCSVARLLYEAMTGQAAGDGAEIARACKTAALDRRPVIDIGTEK